MSDVPTIPFDQYTRPFRDRVGDAVRHTPHPVGEVPHLVAVPGERWVAPPPYARRAEPSLPYPGDEVSNALVELDIAEEAEHAATLARTADRLAAAYAAHVMFLRTAGRVAPLDEWAAGERAAAFELGVALTEYEEARA